jgi:fructose-1,6-bisphosphatase
VDVQQELIAEAKAAKEHKAAYDRHIKRVRELLIIIRKEQPELTVAELEEMIGKVYDRGTISRRTAGAIGTAKPKTAPKGRRQSRS